MTYEPYPGAAAGGPPPPPYGPPSDEPPSDTRPSDTPPPYAPPPPYASPTYAPPPPYGPQGNYPHQLQSPPLGGYPVPGYPPPGAYPIGLAPRPGRSLRVLGVVVQLMLVIQMLVDVLIIPAVSRQRSLVLAAVSDPGSVSLPDVEAADRSATTYSHLSMATLIGAAILFAIWFTLARSSAEEFDQDIHRRSRPWAFWGWICPVVNLWFPYQIATDTLLASDRPVGSRSPGRHGYPLLRLWWACWIVCLVASRIVAADHPKGPSAFAHHVSLEIAYRVVVIVTAILAVLVVGRITGSNERFRAAVLAPRPRG